MIREKENGSEVEQGGLQAKTETRRNCFHYNHLEDWTGK